MSAARLIQLVTASKHHNLELIEEGVAQMLLQDDIKYRSVAIISVANDLLHKQTIVRDHFLRYLYAQYRKKDVTNWIEQRVTIEDQRKTAGIMMWSDIFTYDYETGEQIAIILLDIQSYGERYDTDGSNGKNSSSISVLSTLISSIQCFTVSEFMPKRESECFKTLLDYGKVFNASSKEKPLQKLVLLMQNSGNYEECSNGAEILRKALENAFGDGTMNIEQELQSCFSDISYYAAPGDDSPLTEERISNLEYLIPSLLSPKNIVVKTFNGSKIKAQAFLQLIKSHMAPFGVNGTVDARSIFMASADASNMLAIIKAKSSYSFVMGIHAKNSDYPNLKICHDDTYHRDAIPTFNETNKLGGTEFSAKYMKELDQVIRAEFSRIASEVVKRAHSFTDKCVIAKRLAKQSYIDSMERAVSNGQITEETFKIKHEFAEKKAKLLFKEKCGIEEVSAFERGPFLSEYHETVDNLQRIIDEEKQELKLISIKPEPSDVLRVMHSGVDLVSKIVRSFR